MSKYNMKRSQKQAIAFKKKADDLIEKIETLINKMPDKGNSSSESQKICLQIAINEFSHNVNGVEPSDFEEEKD